MKIKCAEQILLTEVTSQKYDVVICASGYESRATHLASRLSLSDAKKVVIAFEEWKQLPQRVINDKKFKELGFEEFLAKEGNCDKVIEVLNCVFSELLFSKELNVLVDYSCMTKVWYATIINYFSNRYSEIGLLNLTFSYSPSQYSDPQPPMPNKYMGPIPGIYCVSTANKPTALILGLGYEEERAQGIVEYLDPKLTFAFYSEPAFDQRFVEVVKSNNRALFSSMNFRNTYPHPIGDLKSTESVLESLCLSLKNRYRIILAPLGPKPFALLCLLLAAKYPEIDVWRVSAGDSGNKYDRLAAEIEPVVCKVLFEKDQVYNEIEIVMTGGHVHL